MHNFQFYESERVSERERQSEEETCGERVKRGKLKRVKNNERKTAGNRKHEEFREREGEISK